LRWFERRQAGVGLAGLCHDDLLSPMRPFEKSGKLGFGFVDVYNHGVNTISYMIGLSQLDNERLPENRALRYT
jgi:hypothetical protein